MTDSIAQLLAPHDPAILLQAIRRHERLHLSTGRDDAFARLLPWSEINRAVTVEALTDGRVTAARQGRAVPIEMLVQMQPGSRRRLLMPEWLQDLCRQGLSLVLNDIGDQVPAIDALNRMIERELRTFTNTNAYVSFARDSAFKAHWDDHDVLILQVAGAKRWFSYGQPHRFPLRGDTFPSPGPVDLQNPAWQGVMRPGDVLYLPRGEVHRAEIEGDSAVHLTVGLTPARGADVLRWLATQSETAEFGRRDIHAHGDPATRADLAAALRSDLHKLVDGLDLDGFLADQDRHRAFQPALNLGLSLELGPETRLQPALRRRIPLPPQGADGSTALVLGKYRASLSADERRALELVLLAGSLTMAALADAMSGATSGSDAKAAAASLARKGLVLVLPAA